MTVAVSFGYIRPSAPLHPSLVSDGETWPLWSVVVACAMTVRVCEQTIRQHEGIVRY